MNFTQIKETCLYVADLNTTRSFYGDKLGMPVISFVQGRHVFFRTGTSVLLCFLSEVTKVEAQLPRHFAYGEQHIAFECEPHNYEEWKQRVQEAGVTMEHEASWQGGRYSSFYFRDPDGHLLEVVPRGMWGDQKTY